MLSTRIRTDPSIYLIKVPFSSGAIAFTNCYAIVDGGACLIVDTGAPTPEGAVLLQAALEELSLSIDALSIFLTHLHLDHAGLVDRIAAPSTCVYLGAREYHLAHPACAFSLAASGRERLVAEGASAEEAALSERMLCNLDSVENRDRSYKLVEDGDEIAVGRLRLRAVETPGHSPGQMALWEPGQKILFGGDQVLFGLSPSIGLSLDGADSYRNYLESLDKIASLPLHALCAGHGDSRADFFPRIAWLAEHKRNRLTEVAGIVRAHPDLTGVEIVKRINWNVPHREWDRISLPQRCCIIGEGLAALDHLRIKEEVRSYRDEQEMIRYREVK